MSNTRCNGVLGRSYCLETLAPFSFLLFNLQSGLEHIGEEM